MATRHPPALPFSRPVKKLLVGRVRALFNDTARGEKPVQRKEDGLFGSGSVAWRVHADVTSMMIGGISALLLQMLHPRALAGVWDHSDFRHDTLGRLRRTARFIALTTYGGREEAETALARVRSIHDRVHGTLPDGTAYDANDPHLLTWVHVTEAVSFLNGWIRYGEPDMPAADQDRYFKEVAQIAARLGATDIPESRTEATLYIESMRKELVCDDRARTVARFLLKQPSPQLAAAPFHAVTLRAGIDLLPEWARRMHGLSPGPLSAPLVRIGATGMARTLRWAFR
ncbi:uncharacterized protein (DUF2236 family) [Stakelama sediminis]|uniref:Uncharacterized protein (DUF2236 family) n=1 Tax=Stakelama sediminis TaxID=463200 RepID=A0A840YWT2_9SPHN|nr:oxygenase MpaB family protein [Stakelama sediminis]MBB5718025.1 uncharacterized protein (DUF2236 family) [Stakelama sediminis]